LIKKGSISTKQNLQFEWRRTGWERGFDGKIVSM